MFCGVFRPILGCCEKPRDRGRGIISKDVHKLSPKAKEALKSFREDVKQERKKTRSTIEEKIGEKLVRVFVYLPAIAVRHAKQEITLLAEKYEKRLVIRVGDDGEDFVNMPILLGRRIQFDRG